MSTPEGAVKAAITNYLLYTGWLILRVNQGARVTENEHGKRNYARFAWWQAPGTDEHDAGIADVLAFRPGCPPLAVECKAGNNQPTAKQQAFLDAWTRAGGLAVVAYGVADVARAVGEE